MRNRERSQAVMHFWTLASLVCVPILTYPFGWRLYTDPSMLKSLVSIIREPWFLSGLTLLVVLSFKLAVDEPERVVRRGWEYWGLYIIGVWGQSALFPFHQNGHSLLVLYAFGLVLVVLYYRELRREGIDPVSRLFRRSRSGVPRG